jgi:hypothetical protein
MTRALWRQNTFTLNDSRLLAPKYSRVLHWKCSSHFILLILLFSRMLRPFYSWSASLIGSAYLFLYISFCFRFNKTLKNLTSLRQHHLQYTGGLAETQGLLLPSLYNKHTTHHIFRIRFYEYVIFFYKINNVTSFGQRRQTFIRKTTSRPKRICSQTQTEFYKRLLFVSEQLFLLECSA